MVIGNLGNDRTTAKELTALRIVSFPFTGAFRIKDGGQLTRDFDGTAVSPRRALDESLIS